MVNTIDYLYLILVPAAKAFRERYEEGAPSGETAKIVVMPMRL